MTKIVILSDSHDNLPVIRKALPYIKEINPDFIIHAGDIISPFTLKLFKEVKKKFYGVFGNNDGEKILLLKIAHDLGFTIREQPLFINTGNYKIVVIHGIDGKEETKKFVRALAKSKEFDLVVYGHIHEIDVSAINGVLVVNPGELSGYLTGKSTFAIVDLDEKRVKIKEIT